MTKKIIAFGASNSSTSINKQLATWVASQIPDAGVTILDLNEYEMPIYSKDRESESGIPELAQNFKNQLKSADGIIISFAEYNGSYTSAFKNIHDWISRFGKPIWPDVPMFLLATSPGGRGAQLALKNATTSFPHQGANVVASFSLPSFGTTFKEGKGIVEEEVKTAFEAQLAQFVSSL